MTEAPEVARLIEQLRLEPHVEGGYFRRIFSGTDGVSVARPEGPRPALTSIQYLLTARSRIGHWHLNRSTIVHYFQLGDPLCYRLLTPDGELETLWLGPDPAAGHRLFLVVPGGVWKSSELVAGGAFGLIAEAVSPGFDYADMQLGVAAELVAAHPQHEAVIRSFCRA
ncbi:MAG: cupin domain-containing protein [Pseudomonadota bacterium]